MNKLEQIIENDPETKFLKADGFDDAVIGRCFQSNRLIYSTDKIIEQLVSNGMSTDDAEEYFTYNILGAYVGEKTPIYLNDLELW